MGILTTVALVCRVYAVTEGSLEISFDGEAALDACAAETDPEVTDKCYDLIMAVRRQARAIPIKVTYRHVKGHQDDTTAYHQLDRWSKLNVTVDSLAKSQLRKILHSSPMPNQPLSGTPMKVFFKGQLLSHLPIQRLYSEIFGVRTKRTWCTYHGIPPSLVDQGIYWDGIERAMRQEPQGKRRFITKFCAKQLAHGRNMKRRQHQPHDHCPRCDATDEDTFHILQCPAPQAYTAWTQALEDWDEWMRNEHTEDNLRQAIVNRLACWRDGTSPIQVETPRALQQALDAQDTLGWHNFLMGRFTPLLKDFQQTHYLHKQSRKTGNAWARKMASQAWLLAWKLWEHRNHTAKSGMTSQDRRDHRHLLNQVRQEFQKGVLSLDRPDRWLLKEMPPILLYDIPELREWLNQVATARRASASRADKEANALRGSQRLMARWRASATSQDTTASMASTQS